MSFKHQAKDCRHSKPVCYRFDEVSKWEWVKRIRKYVSIQEMVPWFKRFLSTDILKSKAIFVLKLMGIFCGNEKKRVIDNISWWKWVKKRARK